MILYISYILSLISIFFYHVFPINKGTEELILFHENTVLIFLLYRVILMEMVKYSRKSFFHWFYASYFRKKPQHLSHFDF